MTNPILGSLILATPLMATSHTVNTELPCLQIHNHNVMHPLSLASGVTRSVIMLIIVPTVTHNHSIIVAIILSLRCHHSLSHTLSINIHNLNSKFNLLEIHNLPDLSGKLIILHQPLTSQTLTFSTLTTVKMNPSSHKEKSMAFSQTLSLTLVPESH